MLDNDKNYCTIYLVRHGESEWNVNDTIEGQKNSPLTEQGIRQAITTAQELKDIKFDAIFSSDLGRAQRTAEILKLERDLAIQTSHLLRERSYGHFEGGSVAEYKKETKNLYEQFLKMSDEGKWTFKCSPEAESDEELFSRFITKLREIAVAAPGKTILLVTHGGGIRMFLMKMGYAKREELYPGAFSNAGYIKLLSDGIDFFIKEVKGLEARSNNV